MRVGLGYDLHALVEGRALILGGVRIPFDRGLLGHSDADALCHAVADALLGAAALGDIGEHFPDTAPAYKDADSLRLLAAAASLVREAGWDIVNVDSVIVAQAPRLSPFKARMAANLARALGVPGHAVSVKAKTHEGFDATGRGEAVAVQAVALLERPGRV
jgi:2-C-methyl-D-erythritol 2,4-cyclodiphosphate synthase